MQGKRMIMCIVAIVLIAVTGTPAQASPGGGATRPAVPLTASAWYAGMHSRSEALNHRYGLGRYEQGRAAGATAPGWLQALKLRSEALNRMYGLGA